MKELERSRLKQARESLEEAQALLASDMDTGFVLTHLHYAYYYPILAIMNEGQVPSTMQSVTIGLFEQQYINKVFFNEKYGDAIQRIFSIKPKCSGEKTPVSTDEVKELAALAGSFIETVENYLVRKSDVSQGGTMASTERRNDKNNMVRSGSDRRVKSDPNYKGPDRRKNEERRTGKDRRKRP